ncbi:MAG: response regulator [Fulvivirga sp.]
MKKLNCILLVDDDDDCNFFHMRLFNKMGITERTEVTVDGKEAIDFLKSVENGSHPQPAIIFLDINMPVMDGWEFLEAYGKLNEGQKAQIVLIMLTTSLNPDDKERALNNPYINDFHNKYLSKEDINKILRRHFPELADLGN